MTTVDQVTETPIEQIAPLFIAQETFARARPNPLYSERINSLRKLNRWLDTNPKAIEDALYADFKKPGLETDISEILAVKGEIKHTLKHLKEWMRPQPTATPLTMLGTKAEVRYEPKGVALIIAPWNYPFSLLIGPLVSALAAGCTCILKPSEMTPGTSKLVQRMAGELFDPQEVAVVEGGIAVSEELLKLPFNHIFFTGSPGVGKVIMRAAAEHLTSVTLELGGKSPVVVDQTANLKDTAEKIVWGKCLNAGQTCVAPDYLLVHESKVTGLIEAMKVAMKKSLDPEGKGIEAGGNYARIINTRHYQRLVDSLNEAKEKGATVEIGGAKNDADCYLEPTVLSKVPEDAGVMQDEIFGPILPIKPYKDIDDAIDYILDKPKPLAIYYFGKKNGRMKRLLHETSAGNVVVNDVVLHFAHTEIPFGGVNNSGIGKAHGHFGFLAFSNEKGVLFQRSGITLAKLFYPPYTNRVASLVKLAKKYF